MEHRFLSVQWGQVLVIPPVVLGMLYPAAIIRHLLPFGPFTLTSCHPAPSNPIPSLLQAVIVGISVQKLTRENTVKHTMAEVQQIRSLAGRDDVLQLLANSLAPSIYGHDIIKRGLVLQVSEELKRSSDMVTHTSVMCDALH